MKKRLFFQFLIAIFVVAIVGAGVFVYLNQGVYTYDFSDEFYNIAVCFAGSGAYSRAFSFNTKAGDAYWDKCVVQLDPAGKDEITPVFNDKDNFKIEAQSNANPTINGSSRVIVHFAYTRELEEDTKYFYRVGSPSHNLWSRWGYFITDDGDDSFTFMHITDSQAEGVKDSEAFAQTLTHAFLQAPETEFVFSTGDQVEFPFQSYWDRFFTHIDDIIKTTTFAAVNGNHEIAPDTLYASFYVPSDSDMYCYAYEYGNCLFLIIDNNTFSYNKQLTYLASIIENSNAKWKIIGAHKSPFTPGVHSRQADTEIFKEAILPFVKEYNIDLVLSGHDHLYSRTYPLDENAQPIGVENEIIRQEGQISVTSYTQPGGTIFIGNRCSGTQYRNKSTTAHDDITAKADQEKRLLPMYSIVKIEGNKLSYIAYEHCRDTDTTSVYDWCEILKN